MGNKVDLEDERVITKNEGQEFAKKHNCKFFETSAKMRINVGKKIIIFFLYLFIIFI